MARIEIIAVPPGEAPEEVRTAWVGLVLPLAHPRAVRALTSGVLTGPRSRLGRFWARLTGRFVRGEGYAVEAAAALAVLARERPEAARWWATNTPHLLASRRLFLFDAAVCRELPDV